MTQEEKAKELVDKCYQLFPLQQDVIVSRGEINWDYDNWKEAKKVAIICVDEIILSHQWFFSEHYSKTIDFDITHKYSDLIKFWKSVKAEIEKL